LRLASRALDDTGGFLRALFVQVKNRNLGAFFAETFANRAPYAASAAGYDHAFSTQSSHVEILLSR